MSTGKTNKKDYGIMLVDKKLKEQFGRDKNKNTKIPLKIIKASGSIEAAYILVRLILKSENINGHMLVKTTAKEVSLDSCLSNKVVISSIKTLCDLKFINKTNDGFEVKRDVFNSWGKLLKDKAESVTINSNMTTLFGGDIRKAILLRQIIFGTSITKNKSGYYYETYQGLSEKLSISERTNRYNAKFLSDIGYIKHEVHRANCHPTNHFKVNYDVMVPDMVGRLSNIIKKQDTSYILKNIPRISQNSVERIAATDQTNAIDSENEEPKEIVEVPTLEKTTQYIKELTTKNIKPEFKDMMDILSKNITKPEKVRNIKYVMLSDLDELISNLEATKTNNKSYYIHGMCRYGLPKDFEWA